MNFLKNNFNLFAKDKCKFTWYALNSVITGVSMQSLIFKISFWVFVSFNLKIRLLPMTFCLYNFLIFPFKNRYYFKIIDNMSFWNILSQTKLIDIIELSKHKLIRFSVGVALIVFRFLIILIFHAVNDCLKFFFHFFVVHIK